MAWYPNAVHRPLPENATQSRIDPTQFILHTAVDAPGETDLYGFFARGDVGVESHFFIQLDGDVIQYMDTTVQADANRYANPRAVSAETEDDGNPDQRAWTPAQMQSIKLLGQWLMKEHPRIARRVCPAWDQPGWGYHSMWGAPSQWTPSAGKTCPGAPRIAQFKNDITPWLAGASPVQEEQDLTPEESRMLKSIAVSCVPFYQDAQAADGRFQVQTLVRRSVPSPAVIADAVVKALPVSAGGDVDEAALALHVEAAVRRVFADAGQS